MKQNRLGSLIFAGALSVTGLMWAQTGKAGQPNPKPGVHYTLMLVRDGMHQPVSKEFPFRTGDNVSLAVRVDFDSYVYVLNRTMTGDPEKLATRSLALVAEEDSRVKPDVCPYALVFPQPGQEYHLKAGVTQMVPPRGQTMQMKDPAGVERLMVIVSPHPEPAILAMFSSKTGCTAPHPTSAASEQPKADSNDDVLDRFNKRLIDMEANSEPTERGFDVVVHPTPQTQAHATPAQAGPVQAAATAPPANTKASPQPVQSAPNPVVVVAKRPKEPIAVEISLKHLGAA